MFLCCHCCYKSKDKISFVKHLFQAHNSEPDFKYTCATSLCSRTFITGDLFDAFRSHCVRYHHNWKEQLKEHAEEEHSDDTENCETDSNNLDVCTSVEGPPEDGHVEANTDDHVNNVQNSEKDYSNHDLVVNIAQFILNLKEKFKFSQVCLNFVIQSVEELLKFLTESIKQTVLRKLHQAGVTTSPLLDDCFLLVNQFACLKTEYQQTKFYNENFNLIVRITIVRTRTHSQVGLT